jgi:centrosomal protein CEP76
MEQVKHLVKEHLEKNKFFDTIKSAVSKDPNLAKLDRNQILEKLKSEGILGDIISTMPSVKKGMTVSQNKAGPAIDESGSGSLGGSRPARGRSSFKNAKGIDPNKRYLSCNIASGRAFVDFVNPRDDEYISIAVSFLKNRFHTKHSRAGCEVFFDETFIFEFEGEHQNSKFDASLMLKLNQPLHLTILRHRKNEKPVVLGTKNIDWRALLYCNSCEINAEIQPCDMTHKGSLGIVCLNLDLIPNMLKSELVHEESVSKQQELENKYDQETLQKFLDYANNWWAEYKEIRPSHKQRLVKIFAETDDREASVYKPTCSLVQPMYADRILDSPLHAARFVSLIPFQRLEAPGAEKVEVWHSMQAFLSRGCGDCEDHAVLLCNLLIGFGLDCYVCVGTNGEGSHAWVL